MQRSCFQREVSSAYRSELGNTFMFKLKCFALFGFVALARAPLHVLYKLHTHTHVFATYSSSLPPLSLPSLSLLSSLFFSSCYYGVCASLSLYVGSMATLLSFGPRTMVTPQLCSSLRVGANKEAKDEVREGMRERTAHTHMWLTRRFEGGNTVWPLFTPL